MNGINVTLIATPKDLEQWLESYYLNKYSNDEPGIWSTHGRVSFHSSKHGAITFIIKVPNPGELLIVSVEYKRNDQSQIYVENLMKTIMNRFKNSTLSNGSSVINIFGDYVQGDKFGGDKVKGNKK